PPHARRRHPRAALPPLRRTRLPQGPPPPRRPRARRRPRRPLADSRATEDRPKNAGIVIRAYGRPITQGSKIKTRHGLVDDNAKTLKPWRNTVRLAAEDAVRYHDTIE